MLSEIHRALVGRFKKIILAAVPKYKIKRRPAAKTENTKKARHFRAPPTGRSCRWEVGKVGMGLRVRVRRIHLLHPCHELYPFSENNDYLHYNLQTVAFFFSFTFPPSGYN